MLEIHDRTEEASRTPRARIIGWWEAVASLVYPDVCVVCETGKAGRGEGYVCAGCRAGAGHLRWIREPYCRRCGIPYAGERDQDFVCENCGDLELAFERARAAVVATPFVLDLVHRYKYGGAVWLEPFFARLLTEAAVPELRGSEWDAVVAVPLHGARERERGFNQAERLASVLAGATGIPLRRKVVRRVRSTQTQALLDRRDRVQNVTHAFTVGAGAEMSGCRVVVVDDVLTTGATTSAVSRALLAGGAAKVMVWTVARGE